MNDFRNLLSTIQQLHLTLQHSAVNAVNQMLTARNWLIGFYIVEFEHGDIGQLNTYLNYFKAEICEPDDNQPVGILLVAEKDHALVKYATAGMDKNLFVQKYMLQLPDTVLLKQYVEKEFKEKIPYR